MKDDELVLVDYTGRTDGEIFDTTREEDAAEFDSERRDAEYKPVPVLVGRGYVIDGLEEKIREMKVGDSGKVEVPPEKGYGERSSENIETYPEREFAKQDVQVSPGEEVVIGRRRGKVISAGSGRVRIDFNHPLSGKTLEYDLEVVEKVEGDEEIARRIYSYRVGGDEEPEFEDGRIVIPAVHSHGDHEQEIPEDLKQTVREEITAATDLEVEFS